jgi:acetyl-CoA carboxylase biotin carboxyl carrier protein
LNFKEILQLIDRVAKLGIAGVEIEQAGTKIRIEGKVSQPQVIHSYVRDAKNESPMIGAMPLAALPAAPPAPSAQQIAAAAAKSQEEADAGLHIITSPIVGTFYRSANPEAEPFVNVGDRVTKGKVLCIIEAMKLMNEIESDVDGVVAAIYPQSGQPVEYGERIFAIRV